MILLTFPDGITEERPATSPALLNPDNPADIHARDPRKVAPSELSFLRDFTRSGNVYVWCLTGEADGALTGEWRRCHAETSAEQIERLTRERDAAEKRIADLRAWAKKEADAWDETADVLNVSPGGTAWHLAVDRIDGKAAT